MIKLVITLARKEGTSFEEFKQYYLDEHVPIAEEIPNLQKYTVAFALSPDRSEYDAVAELYFEDAAAMKEGMESEAAGAALDDVPNFADHDAGFNMATEELVQVDET
ncbi:conserved hypothetical protein [Halogranum amylolyticum]|uniref:EthD domain-containing protein n=1 Tax=Halogranum amylolyticum TaxID=660520 RepID=A0A1H8N986_9EURY|nr:EthD family reductase [Halogranum amylolyticum]SEO26078.1 conserved hypothetical protein [Halogranum amylolyticum]